MTKQLEIQALIENIKKENENATIEGELLRKRMIRQLYKLVGEPTEEDFPEEFKTAGRYWKKFEGYTTWMRFKTEREMEWANNEDTDWYVKRPSITKIRIVEEYAKAGWKCRVDAYNVMCSKYVKHPRYDNLWVEFYSSRMCNKYGLVIEKEGE